MPVLALGTEHIHALTHTRDRAYIAREQSWHFVCGRRLDANASNKTANNLTDNMRTKNKEVKNVRCSLTKNSFIQAADEIFSHAIPRNFHRECLFWTEQAFFSLPVCARVRYVTCTQRHFFAFHKWPNLLLALAAPGSHTNSIKGILVHKEICRHYLNERPKCVISARLTSVNIRIHPQETRVAVASNTSENDDEFGGLHSARVQCLPCFELAISEKWPNFFAKKRG